MKYETQNTGIENMRYDFMPVGSIVPFASDIIPLGWLLCDGAQIERSRYPELFDLIGDKLPDHRGMFLRGNDNGRGIDAGRILGSEQGDNIKFPIEILQSFDWKTASGGNYTNDNQRFLITGNKFNTTTGCQGNTLNNFRYIDDVTETRPKNNSVNYIIKALHIANPSMEYQVADGLNHKIETNYSKNREMDNAIWGGEYGGYIQDESAIKIVGRRYIDEVDKKAYVCKIANSHVNTVESYSACNVVDSLSEYKEGSVSYYGLVINYKYNRETIFCNCEVAHAELTDTSKLTNGVVIGQLPSNIKVLLRTEYSFSDIFHDDVERKISLDTFGRFQLYLTNRVNGGTAQYGNDERAIRWYMSAPIEIV